MEFKITKDTFLKALQKVQGIIETRKTMPILSNVFIEAHADGIDVTATDLEVGMKSSYTATVTKTGKVTVSAKKIYEIIKELPDSEIYFSTRENDWVDLRCGKAHFNIVGLSPDEFPYFPKINDCTFIKLDGAILNRMVEKTAYAICHDETKYNLNGVFIKATEKDGKIELKMVATDGHRLAITESEFEGSLNNDLQKGVIFPKKGIYEIKRITEDDPGDILLSFMDNSCIIRKGNTTVVMRLVDGEFPDYTRVLPVNSNKTAIINCSDFLHTLKRMSILSSDKYKGIRLELQNGNMEISANNPELGEARESLEVKYEGETIAMRFNAKYFIDVLSVMEESEVELNLKDELSPAILKPLNSNEFLSVIMPMRL